jgi:REP element-mobilizing transposase RayT
MEDKHIYKDHNKSLLLYHFVFPAKCRRTIFIWWVENTLVEICSEIELRYDIKFEEIWADENHIHFLIQSIPTMSVTWIVTKIKSIIAKRLFDKHPEIKRKLRWWNLWTRWCYVNTVWMYWGYDTIKNYIKNQWTEKGYKEWYKEKNEKMVSLFEWLIL